MSNGRRPPIRTFDDFEQECKLPPDDREPIFAVTDPLELHFFEVADKHGILDRMADDDWDE